jgi:hypothetical protein
MKNLITKLIITLVAIMFSLSVFGQTSDADQTGADCLAKGSQVKYEVKLKRVKVGFGYANNKYKWVIESENAGVVTIADASCYDIVSPADPSYKIELLWKKVGVYNITLVEKTSSGTCKGRLNLMKVEVIDNVNKNTFDVKLLNKEFCADDLYSQTLLVKLIAGKNQDVAYPIVLKYTIDGVVGVKEATFNKSEIQVDLSSDLTLSKTRIISKGLDDEIITFKVISIKDKYGADVANVAGSPNTVITIHRHPTQSEIKHD